MASALSHPLAPEATISFSDLQFEVDPLARPGRDNRVVLGRGAHSVVYAATLRGEPYAVKVFPALALSAEEVAEFWREASLGFRLRHDHVVAVEGAAAEGGASGALSELALVMARMTGGTLDAWAASPEGRSAPRAARLRKLLDVALGLRYLHAHDVVHADLKPSNVLLDGDGRARLADLGLARVLRAGEVSRSTLRGGTALGTPLYMDPSLRAGGALSTASDVYALAILCWEVLVGAKPFADVLSRGVHSGDSLAALYSHVDAGGRPDVAAVRDSVLGAVLVAGWAAAPAARPSAGSVAAALKAALIAAHAAAAPPGAAAAAAPPALDEDPYECAICLETCKAPVTASCGAHNFCRACLAGHIRAPHSRPVPKCPSCMRPIQTDAAHLEVNRAIDAAIRARGAPQPQPSGPLTREQLILLPVPRLVQALEALRGDAVGTATACEMIVQRLGGEGLLEERRKVLAARGLGCDMLCAEFVAAGAPSAVVAAMRVYAESAEVARWGCTALRNLGSSDVGKAAVMAVGAPAAAIAALRAHPRSDGVAAWACALLGGLANDAGRDVIVAAGAPAAVISAMRAHSNSTIDDVAAYGCMALRNFSASASGAAASVAAGGVATVAEALSTHAGIDRVTRYGGQAQQLMQQHGSAGADKEARVRSADAALHLAAVPPRLEAAAAAVPIEAAGATADTEEEFSLCCVTFAIVCFPVSFYFLCKGCYEAACES